MSQNPYAQPGPQYADTTPADARTSILAVLSLLSGVAGLIICCIPPIGLLGVLFGVPALFSISAARGRKKGSGMAITGIVTGLIGAAIGTAMWAGMAMQAGRFTAYAVVLEHTESLDASAARAEFDASVREEVTPERLEAFREAYQSEIGAYVAPPDGLGEMLGGYFAVSPQSWEAFGELGERYGTPVPMTLEFAQEEALTIFALGAGQNGRPQLLNVGVIVPDTGDIIWLLPPAPQAPAPAGEAPEAPDGPDPDGESPPEGDEGGG